jgi:hypothetical protein
MYTGFPDFINYVVPEQPLFPATPNSQKPRAFPATKVHAPSLSHRPQQQAEKRNQEINTKITNGSSISGSNACQAGGLGFGPSGKIKMKLFYFGNSVRLAAGGD